MTEHSHDDNENVTISTFVKYDRKNIPRHFMKNVDILEEIDKRIQSMEANQNT